MGERKDDMSTEIGALDEAGVAELNRLRMENHRLAEVNRAVDINRIRLRAGLREALEIAERIERDSGNWRGKDRAALAELRKLLGPEGT